MEEQIYTYECPRCAEEFESAVEGEFSCPECGEIMVVQEMEPE